VTGTVDAYVATAARLRLDRLWRMSLQRKISENKHRVYRNTACTSSLEEFLARLASKKTKAAAA
jgi:hypothetical protein